MAYVPGCTHDIFISYASENNRDGWVDQFHSALANELTDLLGRKFVPKESIYFDKRALEIAQDFTRELSTAAAQSAILLPVLSPSYLTSDWCDRERIAFFEQLPHGATPAACLAPIEIRPFKPVGLTALYANAQYLSFIDPADHQSPLPAGSAQWTAQLKVLAKQLAGALQKLRFHCKPVYVGAASASVLSVCARANCIQELESRFFRTAPESLQAFDDPTAILQQSALAVHFLGGSGEAALKAIQTSAEICPGPTILYQPFGEELTPTENLFLLEFEKQLQPGAANYQRLAGKNDQELIALIDDQLTRAAPAASAANTQLHLALICDDPDLAGVRQLKTDLLARRTINVDFPDFLSVRLKAMERVRKWQEFIRSAPELVFYHGLAERERIETIWQMAEQTKAARNWYLAPPDLDSKRQQHPDALWNIEQLLNRTEKAKGVGAP
jgi:hypothetical protein